MAELIWVIPGERGKVGFWERHPDHPGGEAFVADDAASGEEPRPVQIARTPAASIALGRRRIIEVRPPQQDAGVTRRGRAKFVQEVGGGEDQSNGL